MTEITSSDAELDNLVEKMKSVYYDEKALDVFKHQNNLLVENKRINYEKYVDYIKSKNFDSVFEDLYKFQKLTKSDIPALILNIKKTFDLYDSFVFFVNVQYVTRHGDKSTYLVYSLKNMLPCNFIYSSILEKIILRHIKKQSDFKKVVFLLSKLKKFKKARFFTLDYEMKKKDLALIFLDFVLILKKIKSKKIMQVNWKKVKKESDKKNLLYWDSLILYFVQFCDIKDLKDSHAFLDVFARKNLIPEGVVELKDLIISDNIKKLVGGGE